MKKLRKTLIALTLSFATLAPVYLTGCSETKEVKVTEEINTGEDELETKAVEPVERDVNVNVEVEQPDQAATTAGRTTEVTNVVVDKPDTSRLNNDIASVNTNLQKLQQQVKTANEQNKAQLNKQIQQMNAEKQKLQQQIAALESKNREASNMARESKENMEATRANLEKSRQEMELVKEQYVSLTETKIDNFENKIDDLKEKVNFLEATQRSTVEQQIGKIEQSKDLVEQKLDGLDSVQDSATFSTVKKQIETMITELENNYNKLITERISLR